MKATLLTTALCLLSLWIHAQTEPIALEYSIGAFRIPANLDQEISERFNNLNRNQTYAVTIVGSADFLGSEDNNKVLSNKRVKFAEYHLLKKYRDLRLVIKLDSKGELYAEERIKSSKGVQQHRMVYIYIEDYTPIQNSDPVAKISNQSSDAFNGRTIATASAAEAEGIQNVPVSVSQHTPRSIKPISETAQLEIQKQKQRAAIENKLKDAMTLQDNSAELVQNDNIGSNLNTDSNNASDVSPSATQSSETGTLNFKGAKEPRKFDGAGSFTVGEKLLLSDLNFRPGSHYLRPSSIPSLRKLIDVLEANPSVKIEIIGHICCHPDYSLHPDGFDREAGDNRLSYNRADNIKDYLQKNGIDASRVKATGMGARERLVYPEETDQDRITNRRVEIKILSL